VLIVGVAAGLLFLINGMRASSSAPEPSGGVTSEVEGGGNPAPGNPGEGVPNTAAPEPSGGAPAASVIIPAVAFGCETGGLFEAGAYWAAKVWLLSEGEWRAVAPEELACDVSGAVLVVTAPDGFRFEFAPADTAGVAGRAETAWAIPPDGSMGAVMAVWTLGPDAEAALALLNDVAIEGDGTVIGL
jgi:hypothetical protein